MRNAFVTTLMNLARRDKRIFLLTGDLGFMMFENFRDEFPDRFFNMGAAEANMVGVASGLASVGKIVFVYSHAPFVTERCFEQIKVDVVESNANVKLIGAGSGFGYGPLGTTHYSLEDIGVMRTLPGIAIICPGDPIEVECAILAAAHTNGPVYVRLGKSGEPRIHQKPLKFTLGKGIVLEDGKDLALIATGTLLETGKTVSQILRKNAGLSVRLISMHTIKPIDQKLIEKAARETKRIFTLEEHNIIGGLGSAVAEVIAENPVNGLLFRRLGVRDTYTSIVGSQTYLRSINGLSYDKLVKFILNAIGRKAASTLFSKKVLSKKNDIGLGLI